MLGAILSFALLLTFESRQPRVDHPDGPYAPAHAQGLTGDVEYSIETSDGRTPEGLTVDAATGAITPQPGGNRIVELENGGDVGCARDSENVIWCWTTEKTHPEPVELPDDAVESTVNATEGCALLADRTFRCWAWDDLRPRLTATDVTAAAANLATTCTVNSAGTVTCTGHGRRNHQVTLPEPVTGIAAHGTTTCAHGTRVHCWGSDMRPGSPELPGNGRIERIHVGAGRICVKIRNETRCKAGTAGTYHPRRDITPNTELHGDDLACRRETFLFGYAVVGVEATCEGPAPDWLTSNGEGGWLHIEKTGAVTCAIDMERRVLCGDERPRTLSFRPLDGVRLRATGTDGSTVTVMLAKDPR
jgi:hypothetical protein